MKYKFVQGKNTGESAIQIDDGENTIVTMLFSLMVKLVFR